MHEGEIGLLNKRILEASPNAIQWLPGHGDPREQTCGPTSKGSGVRHIDRRSQTSISWDAAKAALAGALLTPPVLNTICSKLPTTLMNCRSSRSLPSCGQATPTRIWNQRQPLCPRNSHPPPVTMSSDGDEEKRMGAAWWKTWPGPWSSLGLPTGPVKVFNNNNTHGTAPHRGAWVQLVGPWRATPAAKSVPIRWSTTSEPPLGVLLSHAGFFYEEGANPAHAFLLLLAGDVERNPGPGPPCHICGKTIRQGASDALHPLSNAGPVSTASTSK